MKGRVPAPAIVTLTRTEAERNVDFPPSSGLLPASLHPLLLLLQSAIVLPAPACGSPSQFDRHDYQSHLSRAAHALLYVPPVLPASPAWPDLWKLPRCQWPRTRANCTSLPTAVNWGDARYRVLKSYREWLRAVSDPTCLPGVPVAG